MIRLEEKPFELEGKTYLLRCNMAVLETIEDKYGDMDAVMNLTVRQSSLELLTAMLNDYAEDQCWEERWELKQIRRRVNWAMLQELDLVGMLFRSMHKSGAQPAADSTPEPAAGDSGN